MKKLKENKIMGFKEIKFEELDINLFEFWSKDWVLVTAGDKDKANTLTAGWGGFGVFWGKDTVSVYIRSERYTKEFMDDNEGFSITSFGSGNREQLAYLGKVSGRDGDKIQAAGFTTKYDGEVPYIAEGNIVFICKKLVKAPLLPDTFLDKVNDEKFYPKKDYHTLYIAEIEKILMKI